MKNCKKAISFILTAVLLFALAPTVLADAAEAIAESILSPQSVAVSVYNQTQFANALSNPAPDITINISGNFTHNETVSLNNEKKITINLNGYTLTVNPATGNGVTLRDAAVLTINGSGTLDISASGDVHGISAYGTGTVFNTTGGAVVNISINNGTENNYGAYASYGASVTVTNTAASGASHGCRAQEGSLVHITGNAIATGTGRAAYATGKDSKVIVDGDAKNTNTTQYAGGGATALSGATITIGKDAGGYRGVVAESGSTVTVKGNVAATGIIGQGAAAESGGTIIIHGDVTASGITANAVQARNEESSVTVGGNVTSARTGAYVTYGGNVIIQGHTKADKGALAEIGGAITIAGHVEGDSGGVEARRGGTITVGGNVESKLFAVQAYDAGSIVNVGGDAKVTDMYTCSVRAEYSATVNVKGNVSATGDVSGGVSAEGKDTVVTVGGNVTATGGDEYSVGVDMFDGAIVYVSGNISGTNADIAFGWDFEKGDFAYFYYMSNPTKKGVTLDSPYDGYYWDEFNNEGKLSEGEEYISFVYKQQGEIEDKQPPAEPGEEPGGKPGDPPGTDPGKDPGKDEPSGSESPGSNDEPKGSDPEASESENPYIAEDEKIEAFVWRLYNILLAREPDSEFNTWVEWLRSGESTAVDVMYGFVFSNELIGKKPSNELFVELLFKALLDRTPSGTDKEQWMPYFETATRYQIFYMISQAPEFAKLCEEYGIIQGIYWPDKASQDDVESFVIRAYNLCLARFPREEEQGTWINALNVEGKGGRDVVLGFLGSQEFLSRELKGEAFLEVLYKVFLGRSLDGDGKATWLPLLDGSAAGNVKVVNGIAGSQEFAGICSTFGINP